MKTKIISFAFVLLGCHQLTIGQNLIKGVTKFITYNSGDTKDVQLKLKNGETLLIGFRSYMVDIQILNGTNGVTITSIVENKDWNKMQACEFDFDGDGKNEIVIVYGDASNAYLKVIAYKKTNTTYEQIGDFEGQNVCELSAEKIILPYGTQGLFSEYEYKNGKFLQIQ